jgi:thioredoxin-dependent peroxiredoxin
MEVRMSNLDGQQAPNFSLAGSDGMLSDSQAEVMRSYGAWRRAQESGSKTVQGAIRSTVVMGPDGKVLRHWTPVSNAEAHPQEVLQFLGK